MKLISLMYHDVVGPEGFAASGFPGGDADIYKLRRYDFEQHVAALATVARPTTVFDALEHETDAAVLLTFDDGGVSALTHIAPVLEANGARGHFFIPTDWLGRPGFLDDAGVRELAVRGHIIGSHSCSHPPRISHLPTAALEAEWRDSVQRLEDILGAPVRTGSVPAGFYSPAVADAAHTAGIEVLFTSAPSAHVRRHGGVTILGRFTLMRDDPAALARAFAEDRWLPQARQAALWNAKQVVKAVGGEHWLRFRRRVLASR